MHSSRQGATRVIGLGSALAIEFIGHPNPGEASTELLVGRMGVQEGVHTVGNTA